MTNRKPTLDALAKNFLGTGDANQVKVTRSQKANAERQRQLYEQEVMHEACEFGDAIITYIGAMRGQLGLCQRAFGVALAFFNLRRDYPEGPQQFDELVDLAGADLKYPVDPASVSLPTTEWKFDEAQLEAAAQFAELLTKYITGKKHQLSITNAQGAYGLGRTFHSLRYTFPVEEGGATNFDHCAKLAGVYFGNG